jgi:hypothetical protein
MKTGRWQSREVSYCLQWPNLGRCQICGWTTQRIVTISRSWYQFGSDDYDSSPIFHVRAVVVSRILRLNKRLNGIDSGCSLPYGRLAESKLSRVETIRISASSPDRGRLVFIPCLLENNPYGIMIDPRIQLSRGRPHSPTANTICQPLTCLCNIATANVVRTIQ